MGLDCLLFTVDSQYATLNCIALLIAKFSATSSVSEVTAAQRRRDVALATEVRRGMIRHGAVPCPRCVGVLLPYVPGL